MLMCKLPIKWIAPGDRSIIYDFIYNCKFIINYLLTFWIYIYYNVYIIMIKTAIDTEAIGKYI